MIDLRGAAHPEYQTTEEVSQAILREMLKPMKTIIAPIGYARVGKDEFAKVLVEEYGFTRFAFADKLRECLEALNPIVGRDNDYADVPAPRLDYVLEKYGWNGYKESEYSYEIRGLLQRFGTEVGRDLLAEDIWLRELDKVEADKIVITDARFANELEYVMNSGGDLVHIRRKGVNPINAHISETAHLEFTQDIAEHGYTIYNDTTLEDYRTSVRYVMDNFLNC